MVKNARSARIKKNQEGQTAAQSDHNKARENGRKDAPAENVPTTKPPNVRTLVGGPSVVSLICHIVNFSLTKYSGLGRPLKTYCMSIRRNRAGLNQSIMW